jgi:hypothetical protein
MIRISNTPTVQPSATAVATTQPSEAHGPPSDPFSAVTAWATVFLALATLVLAVVPAWLRWLDISRRKRAARGQLILLMRTVEARMATLSAQPEYAPEVLTAGIRALLGRTFEPDVADALEPNEMRRVYPALVNAYDVVLEAADRERTIERQVLKRPEDQRKALRERLRAASDLSIARKATAARRALTAILRTLEPKASPPEPIDGRGERAKSSEQRRSP